MTRRATTSKASPQAAFEEKRGRAGRGRGASRFLGVYRNDKNSGRPWIAQIRIDPSDSPGSRLTLGAWESERAAASAFDRAALFYRGRQTRLNFPKARVTPTDAATLRAEARKAFKAGTFSRYRGVVKQPNGRWLGKVGREGRVEQLGSWDTDEQAARAYDQAARFVLGDNAHLNFPRLHLPAAPPSQVRHNAHRARKLAVMTSKYRGVYYAPRNEARPWDARIKPPGQKLKILGLWPSEREAARAYDRAARLYLGPEAKLNFPNSRLAATDAASLRAEIRKRVKLTRTSRYIGVHWSRRAGVWIATICHRYRHIRIGVFRDERDAARAYDAKALELRGTQAKLNFHPVTGKQIWGKRLIDLALDRTSKRAASR